MEDLAPFQGGFPEAKDSETVRRRDSRGINRASGGWRERRWEKLQRRQNTEESSNSGSPSMKTGRMRLSGIGVSPLEGSNHQDSLRQTSSSQRHLPATVLATRGLLYSNNIKEM